MAKSTFDSNNSAYQRYLENTFLNVPRSRHDLSHVHTGQTTFGILAPVLCLETMPNEDIDLNLTASIQLRNPTPRPLINGCRVYFHAYYNRCRDLWEGFENFVTHGRRQDVQLSKPNLIYSTGSAASAGLPSRFSFSRNSVGEANACTPLSLMDFMGVPAQRLQKSFGYPASPTSDAVEYFSPLRSFQVCINVLENSQGAPVTLPLVSQVGLTAAPDFIDALPFVAYQRNWRDFYSPKNLLMNNINWFPDNENEWLLPYYCPNAVVLNHSDPVSDLPLNLIVAGMSFGDLRYESYWDSYYTETPEPYNPATVADSDAYLSHFMPVLCAIKFRSFSGDRFTSGSPFVDLVRGSIPSLEAFVTSADILGYRFDGSEIGRFGALSSSSSSDFGDGQLVPQVAEGSSALMAFFTGSVGNWYLGLDPAAKVSVTQNDLRKLETITVLRERLARTDGDYSDMIGALFGERPSKESHEGIYIGGCYQDVVFSSVVQTSQSTNDSQLGDKAGQGYSVSNGRIGHFHSDDYGWIQVYMSIVPETYYTQGLDAQFSRDVADKMWNPLMSNMPPQAVLNKEIFVSGDSAVDGLPFSYEQRGNEYRSRRNRVSGFSALSHSVAVYDTSVVMSRRFDDTPSFNSKFLAMTPENIDMDVFSYNDEPPFDFSVGFDLSVVLPMPSVSVAGAMSSSLHA